MVYGVCEMVEVYVADASIVFCGVVYFCDFCWMYILGGQGMGESVNCVYECGEVFKVPSGECCSVGILVVCCVGCYDVVYECCCIFGRVVYCFEDRVMWEATGWYCVL